MRIKTYDASIPRLLKDKLLEEKLVYGSLNSFSSLVTPSSAYITQKEKNDLMEDFRLLWGLYETATRLYLASISGEADPKIAEIAEHDLWKEEAQIQRNFAKAGFEPRSCRIDYISLGEGRKLAEVQWMSGGPGLVLGIQDVFSEIIPFESGTEPFGNSVENFRKMIINEAKGPIVAVNDIGASFANGEEYLCRKYAGSNLVYVPVLRDRFSDYVTSQNGEIQVNTGGRTQKVDFFYLYLSPFYRGVAEAEKEIYPLLVKSCLDGKIWIENPLNFIYKAKWPMALPFMKEFAHLFSDRLRQILPPTVLLGQKMDLNPIVEYFTEIADREKQILSSLASIDGIATLGEPLRKNLIIKCAASRGPFHYGGRGVYRLTGGKGGLEPTIDFIRQRLTMGEPWIVQQFISSKHELPVYLPENLDEPHNINAHTRFIIFGGKGTEGFYIIGGLGNYGKNWKVSGSSPKVDSYGNVYGTAFNDIRVEKDIGERTRLATSSIRINMQNRETGTPLKPIVCTKNMTRV